MKKTKTGGHALPVTPWRDKADFIEFLEKRLIPDLRESGRDATADDFVTAVKFMREPQDLTNILKGYSCRELVDELLVIHGGKALLNAVGMAIKECESAGNGVAVGRTIQELAEIEW